MHRGLLTIGALFSFLSVAFGAFGAHALKSRLSETALTTFETGVRYQFYHALAIILCGILFAHFKKNVVLWAARFFILGIALFSFSLYALAMLEPELRSLGAITPFGGLSFLTAWTLLIYAFVTAPQSSSGTP